MPRNKENKVADTGALTLLGRHRLRGHILHSAQTSPLGALPLKQQAPPRPPTPPPQGIFHAQYCSVF